MAGTLFNRDPDFLNSYKKPTGNPTRLFGNPNTFTAAADTQAKDYDKIMKQYGDIYGQARNNPLQFQSVSPQYGQYSQSPDETAALGNLSELSKTGGYDEKGIADLRARGVSPTRSIYASAQRNIDRQKSLSGGYSPNYGALTAKMAREMSDEIGKINTDVNAGITQNVASNRLAASGTYAGAAGRANEAKTGASFRNADIGNESQRFNASGLLSAQQNNRNQALGATQGMTSLYGTTPALASLYGNQVMQARQSGQAQQGLDDNRRRDMYSMFARRNG